MLSDISNTVQTDWGSASIAASFFSKITECKPSFCRPVQAANRCFKPGPDMRVSLFCFIMSWIGWIIECLKNKFVIKRIDIKQRYCKIAGIKSIAAIQLSGLIDSYLHPVHKISSDRAKSKQFTTCKKNYFISILHDNLRWNRPVADRSGVSRCWLVIGPQIAISGTWVW